MRVLSGRTAGRTPHPAFGHLLPRGEGTVLSCPLSLRERVGVRVLPGLRENSRTLIRPPATFSRGEKGLKARDRHHGTRLACLRPGVVPFDGGEETRCIRTTHAAVRRRLTGHRSFRAARRVVSAQARTRVAQDRPAGSAAAYGMPVGRGRRAGTARPGERLPRREGCVAASLDSLLHGNDALRGEACAARSPTVHLILQPEGMSASGVSRTTRSPWLAASSMPWLSSPRSIAGWRLKTTTIVLPTSSSGV